MSEQRPVVRIDIKAVRALLDRIQGSVAAEDYLQLEALVETLIEVTRMAHQNGATIRRLRRVLGQPNSEKTADVVRPANPSDEQELGEDGGADDEDKPGPSGESDDPKKKKKKKKKKKGHGRIPGSAYDAERIDVPHPHLSAGDRCPGCARGSLYRLKNKPPIVRIFGQAPLTAKAWRGEDYRCGACGDVYPAPLPEEAKGPKYSESAASMLVLFRYGTGFPLNRVDRLQKNLGVPVPATTQWEVALDRFALFRPVYDELVRRGAGGKVIHSDDTYVRILEFMGKQRAKLLAQGELPNPDRTGLFTTGIVAQTEVGPIALFFSGRKHAGENLDELLDQRPDELSPPIQMCDGLDRNVPRENDVIGCNCLVHGRRHIVDEASNFPSKCRFVLDQLGVVFKNERICKEKGLSDDERLRFHQEHSAKVMNELKAWMEAELEQKRVEPNSGLGGAFGYLLKRWDKLTAFLRIPGAPIENNIVERALKRAIMHRKNSLFYKTQRGAEVGDMYMTLIYTAELHGVNPFEYLTALQVHSAAVAECPSDWLPWTYRDTLERLKQGVEEAA